MASLRRVRRYSARLPVSDNYPGRKGEGESLGMEVDDDDETGAHAIFGDHEIADESKLARTTS